VMTFSDAQRMWAGNTFLRNFFDSDAVPRGTMSSFETAFRTREGGGSVRPPVLGIIGAIRVYFLIIPELKRQLGRDPTEAEIDKIAGDWNNIRFSDIQNAVSRNATQLNEFRRAIDDEAKRALGVAKKVQDVADSVRKEVNAVLKKIGLPETPVHGWLEPGQAASVVNKVTAQDAANLLARGSGMRVGLRTFGLRGMAQGAHTNLKLAGLGLGATPLIKILPDEGVRRGPSAPAAPAGPTLSDLGSKAAAALADEAAGNAQLTADKAMAAYLATNAAADVPAAKQAAALADAALVEIKTHQMAARAANTQAEKAFSAETKAAADAKAAAIAAQAAADKKAADDRRAARDQYLETQRTFYMTLDKDGLKSEYLKIKDGGETDLIALLIEVAKTRGLDLLKAAAPYAAIAVAGALGIFLVMRARKASA